MITGAHVVIYSEDAEADRAFLREVLHLTHVDVGGGWLIFALPPSELAVHPAQKGGAHELYLLCDDVQAFRAEMKAQGVKTGPVQNQGWGMLTQVTLPGGGALGVYEPRHVRPPAPMTPKPSARKSPSAAKKAKPKLRR